MHFAALERHPEAFEQVAYELIRHAHAVDPRIGVALFVDSSAFQSASALHHECTDVDACQAAGGSHRLRIRQASLEEVLEQHQYESDVEIEHLEKAILPELERTRGGIITRYGERGPIRYREIFIKRGKHVHRYITRDLSSGVRWYSDVGKFWLGGYLLAAVDMYTGLPIAQMVFPADVMEWDGYPLLFEGMVGALGTAPRIVSVDRGFALNLFYEYNSRRGVAVVAPFRKRHAGDALQDRRTDLFDEHGTPRCRFCGGPGDQFERGLGPRFDRAGEPYIRFRCAVPRTRDCRRAQRVRCAEDWMQLPLLAREAPLFHAVRHVHHNKEGHFNAARLRYAVAGKYGLGRICRSGTDVQRLRCAAALLLDWLRVSLRQGWLAPHELDVRLNDAESHRLASLHEAVVGIEALDELLRYREEQALELPYGPAAQHLRLAYEGIA